MLLSSPLLLMNITNDSVDGGLEHRIWSTLTHLSVLSNASSESYVLGIIYMSSSVVVKALAVLASQARACYSTSCQYYEKPKSVTAIIRAVGEVEQACSMHNACEPDQVHGMLCGFPQFARLPRHVK